MAENKLKICPFCGSSDVEHVYENEFGQIFDYVECETCGVKIRGFHHSKEGKYISAIDVWNRRPDND